MIPRRVYGGGIRKVGEVVGVTMTSRRPGCHLSPKPPLTMERRAPRSGGAIEIHPEERRQTIIGFGGAFTEAAAYTFASLPATSRAHVLRSYFHPIEGLGYTLGRLAIGSSDFSLEPYAYVRDGDGELASFDIAHEREWVIPFVKAAAAAAGRMPALVATPWSPPAWMKTNGDLFHGGSLLARCRPAWARHYVLFVEHMRAEGVPLWGLTVQNEPEALQRWESCLYSPEEERDFVRDHLGPALRDSGHGDLKLLVWDHNRDRIVERAETVLGDRAAAAFVWGVATHWYVSEEFENLSRVHAAHPGTHILFTEGCIEGGVLTDDWTSAEKYAWNMIGDFRNWQEGWIDWNLLLDGTGGPNHAENYCHAPIIADAKSGEVSLNGAWHAIGHFSRFVRPGAVNVETTSGPGELPHVAFLNPDGSIALVMLNDTGRDRAAALSCRGRRATMEMEEHSIATLVFP